MILTAHQPSYLPWIGLFDKINQADTFCFFDCVQYTKKDFVSRNWIKTQNGPQLLTVPVESKNHYEVLIKDARIANHHWERKHCRSIQLAYQHAPYFGDYFWPLEAIYLRRKETFLADLNWYIMEYLLDSLGININVVWASDNAFQGAKSDLVLDMCEQLGASEYIFGAQGRDYADVESFTRKGIAVKFQDYQHPTYSQLHGEFQPNMSVIDLLFNCGPDSLSILRNCDDKLVQDHN